MSPRAHSAATFIALFLASCGGPASAPQPVTKSSEPSKAEPAPLRWKLSTTREPRLFTSRGGVRVEMAPVDSVGDTSSTDSYLVRVIGLTHDLEGVTVLASPVKERGYYLATIGGAPRTIVFEDRDRARWAKGDSGWYLPGPNYRTGLVKLEVGDAKLVSAEDLMRRYKEGLESGLLQRLAPEDRASRIAAQNANFKAWTKGLLAACGPVEAEIDWSDFEDDWFSEFSAETVCGNQMLPLRTFCERHPHRVNEVVSAGPVRCVFEGPGSGRDYVPPRRDKKGALVFTARSMTEAGNGAYVRLRALYDESQKVLRSKAGIHFLVRDEEERNQRLYNGDGKNFYPNGQLSENRGDVNDSLLYGVREGVISRRGGDWFFACRGQGKEEKLEYLQGSERDAVLHNARVEDAPLWKRAPYFLARDSRGIYYYVDRIDKQFGGKRYRVFTGRRGQVKLTKLKGVVEDSVGTVFSTDAGELRLVVKPRDMSATWIRGNKKVELTSVSVDANISLIYDELGAYFGQDFGFVCD